MRLIRRVIRPAIGVIITVGLYILYTVYTVYTEQHCTVLLYCEKLHLSGSCLLPPRWRGIRPAKIREGAYLTYSSMPPFAQLYRSLRLR